MAQPSPSRMIYTFHDGPPPAPPLHLHDGPANRCDACDRLIVGPPAGEGVYLWTRGEDPRYEPAPLCDACATAIGVASLRRLEEEEEEGG